MLAPRVTSSHRNDSGDPATTLTQGVIEWNTKRVRRSLLLCNSAGFTLSRTSPGVRAPELPFTAYLRSDYIAELHEHSLLEVEELHSDLQRMLALARDEIRRYYREKAASRAVERVQEWKNEKIYPYEREAEGPLEQSERQVFDILALNVSRYSDFDEGELRTKKLQFRLLRQIVEQGPAVARKIIAEVLDLPRKRQEELAELLDHTTLDAIVVASKTIADRLNFLRGLEALVFDRRTKQELKERKQLHRILAPNAWIFGEQYALCVDDQSLDEVLSAHLDLIRKGKPSGEKVKVSGKSTGIIDLMLSQALPQPDGEHREHLIVELKRPTVKIDAKAMMQLQGYALAVANDDRFRDTRTRWRFVAVSNDIHEAVRTMAHQRNRPPGLWYESAPGETDIQIWVHTWAEIVRRCQARLRFFEEKLSYKASRDSALNHLRTTYGSYLPDSVVNSTGRGKSKFADKDSHYESSEEE